MPVDHSGRYWVRGSFQDRVISRMSRSNYARARNSTRLHPAPYPSVLDLIHRVDAEGDDWFQDTGPELHLSDFILLSRMQTARRMSQRADRFPGRDQVLDRLMMEGIFDRREPNTPHAGEEFAMQHATSMVQRLLMRVERLEAEVSGVFFRIFG